MQGLHKAGLELGQEMQGPAQKGDLAADGVAAGQAADGLFHHGLEDGGRQILAGRAFVEQGHHVGLGEDAAAGRDGIDGGVARGQGIETGRIGIQQAGHLVDEGPGTAGTGLVHAQIVRTVGKIKDLGVLAPQFHSHVGLRRQDGDGPRRGQHLLHEGQLQGLRQPQGRGTRHGRAHHQTGPPLGQVFQQRAQGRAHRRAMTFITGFQQRAPRIHQGQLDRGGACIEPEIQSFFHYLTPPLLPDKSRLSSFVVSGPAPGPCRAGAPLGRGIVQPGKDEVLAHLVKGRAFFC